MKTLSEDRVNLLRHNARGMVRELGLLNDAYFDIGVTLAERHLLIELNDVANPTVSEIAERLLLDKSTASRLISKAENKGFIQYTPDDNDKRKRFISLTDLGRDTLNAFEPIAFNQTKDALLTLTEEEIDIVYRGVELYAKGLRNSRLWHKSITEQLKVLGCSLEPFSQNDDEPLYDLFREMVKLKKFPYPSHSKKEFRKQFFAPGSHVYVCHHGKEVVGGFYIKPNFSTEFAKVANAAYMIKEKYRKKGIGSLLIKASLNIAKSHGYHAMQYNSVFSNNLEAIQLYQKFGFKIVDTVKSAFQLTYVMYLELSEDRYV